MPCSLARSNRLRPTLPTGARRAETTVRRTWKESVGEPFLPTPRRFPPVRSFLTRLKTKAHSSFSGSADAGIKDRFIGAMVGLAIGDAYGSAYEFASKEGVVKMCPSDEHKTLRPLLPTGSAHGLMTLPWHCVCWPVQSRKDGSIQRTSSKSIVSGTIIGT